MGRSVLKIPEPFNGFLLHIKWLWPSENYFKYELGHFIHLGPHAMGLIVDTALLSFIVF
jgi:hypothetical protein